MGRDLANRYRSSYEAFEEASDALGFDIGKIIFEGDDDSLKVTEITQPAVLATSIACLRPLIENGVEAEVAAGLSLGEYTAHVYAGTLKFQDAVRLVRKRGRYMQDAVPEGVGTMAAIIGLDDETVIECCKDSQDTGVVEPVNFNCPGQVVIAGEIAAVEKAVRLCSEKGAKRAVTLQVSAPFHCRMMEPAAKKIKEELDKITLNNADIPVVANVNAEYVTDAALIAELLVKQVYSPVYWGKSVEKMISSGIDTFIEIGPGKTLTGFVKRISKKVRALNVENIETLESVLSELV